MGIQGVIQLTMAEVPASILLNGKSKSILFVKHGRNNFIDYQDGSDMVAWTNNSLAFSDCEYKYEQWHPVTDDSPLKKYFKSVLQDRF